MLESCIHLCDKCFSNLFHLLCEANADTISNVIVISLYWDFVFLMLQNLYNALNVAISKVL